METTYQAIGTPKLRRPAVRKLCGGIGDTTLYRWIATSGFPKPRRLGLGRVVVWDAVEVEQWLASQPHTDAGDSFGKSGLPRGEAVKQIRADEARRYQTAQVPKGLHLVEGGA